MANSPFLSTQTILEDLPGTIRPLTDDMVKRYQDFFESGQIDQFADLARQVQRMIVLDDLLEAELTLG
jgi:hypothetical protein